MHIATRAALAAGLCFCLTSAYAQLGATQHQKTVGYQDEHGVFHPLVAMPDTITKTDFTGTIIVTVHVTVKSTFASGTIIACQTEALASSDSSTDPYGIAYDDFALAEATGSGSTYTCVVKLPYSWYLQAAGTGVQNSMSVSYTVEALAPSGSIFANAIGGARSSSSSIVELAPIPTVGSTTNYTVNATL